MEICFRYINWRYRTCFRVYFWGLDVKSDVKLSVLPKYRSCMRYQPMPYVVPNPRTNCTLRSQGEPWQRDRVTEPPDVIRCSRVSGRAGWAHHGNPRKNFATGGMRCVQPAPRCKWSGPGLAWYSEVYSTSIVTTLIDDPFTILTCRPFAIV